MGIEGRKDTDAQSHEKIKIAAFDEAIRMFRAQYPESEGEIPTEALESVLYGFFDEQVENARRFESKEQGVSFVYSSVDSADIAKKLYEKYNGQKPEITDATEAGRTGREMIFESFITPENPGAFFTFFEQGLHHVISELPRALEDLKEGKEPKHHEVYFAGHPTRDLGHITPEFVESMKGGHGYERYGQLYAELLGAEMRATPDIATESILLRGISMGAPQALATGEQLVARGLATQSKQKGLPNLQVRIDTAPGESSDSPERRKWKTRLGFVVHGLQALVTDSYVRKTSNPLSGFMKSLLPELERRGMKTEMSPEDVRLKKEAIGILHEELYTGVPVPANLKVTEVVGLSDITMYSKERNEKAHEHREKHAGTVGEAIIPRENDQHRVFGARTGHNIPNFIPNELGRLKKAADALQSLRKR